MAKETPCASPVSKDVAKTIAATGHPDAKKAVTLIREYGLVLDGLSGETLREVVEAILTIENKVQV